MATPGQGVGGGKNLPVSMQARLAAYQEALKAKRELHKQQATTGADVDQLKTSLRNELSVSRESRLRDVGKIEVAAKEAVDPALSPKQREERIERRARSNLHRMFQVVEGSTQLSQKQKDAFVENRMRYMTVVETLAPEPLPGVRGQEKKRAIAKEVVKKEAYGSLKTAWDDYEDAARDRPKEFTDDEKGVRSKLAKVEDRLDMVWVRYAEEVVKRAVHDGDTPPDEIEKWRSEALKMSNDSKHRRKVKMKKERAEEKEYWKMEVMRLKCEMKKQDDELASDEEWVSDLSDDDGD